MTLFQSPRGTRDILPADQGYWQFVLQTAARKAVSFGFDRIDLPTFEDEKLFTRAIGQGTDIVDKEMFVVSRGKTDAKEEDGDKKSRLALRPEATASIVRAYLEHGMSAWTQPVKLWYTGSMFRYDRPQKGRYREFNQIGAELIGDDSPAADALVILFAWSILTSLGLEKHIILDVNTIGDKNCRPKIKKALTTYFTKHKAQLCPDCQRRLATNPLRLLDCKEASCQPIKEAAPSILDLIDEECKIHFQNVLEYLDDLNIPYNLNPHLVRGLDYYTRTTFEIRVAEDDRSQSALGGGGRYDNLIELYEGASTPATGFAFGTDRIIEVLKDKNIEIPDKPRPDICVIQLGDKARRVALVVVKDATEAGLIVVTAPGKDALKGQLRLANKANAKLALIIGQKEANDNTVIIKNLEDGAQETVSRAKLLPALERKLRSFDK